MNCGQPYRPSEVLTNAFGEFFTPLGTAGVMMVAGEEAVAGQRVALVTDVLHRGAHDETRARRYPAAVLHRARIWARQH